MKNNKMFDDSGHWEEISFRRFRNSFRNVTKAYFVISYFKCD